MDCNLLRQSLVALFANELEVTAANSACVVTLPLKTADDRFVDVFVEPVPGSLVTYVHDGAKSTAELFAQGIHPTDTQESMLKGVALAHGATFQNGRFQIACANEAQIHRAVLAIGQCAALAMIEVVSHEPVVEDEALSGRVARALRLWQPSYVEIHRRVTVDGTISRHSFDFVSVPVRQRASTVAVKILHPSIGPHIQAKLYGFLVYDIKGKDADHWRRLAIVAKSEEWRDSALRLVRDLSNDVILLKSDHEERVETVLPDKMNALTEAA